MMRKLCFLLFLALSFTACKHLQPIREDESYYDLPQIKDSGELVILTVNDATASYFIYRGEEMGYQYEISKLFSQSLSVTARIKTVRNVSELSRKLLDGEGDIIIYNFPIMREMKDSLIYCGEEVITHQVIVQQNQHPLRDVIELIGKEVYVAPGKYYDRLANLNDELGGGIQINCLDGDSITTEMLISKVSKGEIGYTICDNQVAQLNSTYFSNLDTKLSISFNQRSSWAVRKSSPLLAETANEWYERNQTSLEYVAIKKRYFELNKVTHYSPVLSEREGKISFFDDMFRHYAKEIGWDWRFLAAIAFTESNFNPDVISWVGAKGLMQLMPETARAMGISLGQENDPEENIKAGTKYLNILEQKFLAIDDKQERANFVLASYNAGPGHVYDAMALAEKYGKDKYVWFGNVEHYLLLKSNEEYYTDPVCKNGYLRGIETYNFVHKINAQYERYKKIIRR